MAISASWAFYARGRSTHPQTRNTAAALLNAGRVGAGVEAAVWALYTDTPPRPVHSVRKVATETPNSTEPSILQTHPLAMSIAQIKNMLESASLYTCARIHDLEKVLVLLLLAQGLILKLLLLSTSRCTADFRTSDLTMPSASNSSAFLMLNHCISCSVTWQNASVCEPVAHHVEQITHDRPHCASCARHTEGWALTILHGPCLPRSTLLLPSTVGLFNDSVNTPSAAVNSRRYPRQPCLR